jgi:ATP-binding cassette subfamily C protein
MGMAGRITARWRALTTEHLVAQQRASDVARSLGALSKVLRMGLQSAVLGVGALLVINQEASAGIIIAGSTVTP